MRVKTTNFIKITLRPILTIVQVVMNLSLRGGRFGPEGLQPFPTKVDIRWSMTLIPKYSVVSVMDRIAQCGLGLQMRNNSFFKKPVAHVDSINMRHRL